VNSVIRWLALFLVCLVSGCAHGWNSDVSDVQPHSKLVNTEWKLTKDAYLISVLDNRKVILIIPATKPFGPFTPDGDCSYNEEKIGQEGNGVKVIGGLRAGEVLKIIRVVKNSHIEMGTTYHPIMVPERSNRWTGDKELDGKYLYDKGILNPEYVEPMPAFRD
jgi:hypothetical protein